MCKYHIIELNFFWNHMWCSMESSMHKDHIFNLCIFVYRLYHEGFSTIVGTNLFRMETVCNLVHMN